MARRSESGDFPVAIAPEDAPLFRFNRERQAIIDAVIDRVTREAIQGAWESPENGLEYLLNEAAYLEMSRLDERTTPKQEQEYQYWREIAHRVGRASEEENAEILQKTVTRYVTDIAGHFRPGVFHFATRILPAGITLLFSRQAKGELLSLAPRMTEMSERIQVEGEIGKLKRLSRVGTLVFVPTHSSHMDSILMGWSLHAAQLPPVTYGAGKNLFTNPMTSFFMANLGAYKVDRRLRHTIYKSVLKVYSEELLERGYHSLFFPGGGRSRSNEVESRLKLGLLGTALDAFTRNVMAGRRGGGIFVVPVTISYNLVLEAETLVDDYLKRGGRERYIIDVDEFSDLRRVAQFVRSTLDMDSTVTIRFGTPLDVFGNTVDQDGESVDTQGRRVDPERYLWVQGKPAPDRERDNQYTRELGERVTEAYRRDNVIYPLHVVSMAIFEHLRRQHPTWDLYRTLRFGKGDAMSLAVAEGETERLLRLVRRGGDEGRFRLARSTQTLTAREVVAEALRYFGTYHALPIVEREGQQLKLQNLKLLFYYGNRLRGYELERRLNDAPGGY